MVQFITSRIEIIPYHEDIRKLITLTELKTAMFFCRTMPAVLMDVPGMRVDMKSEAVQIAAQLEEDIRLASQGGDSSNQELQDAMRDARKIQAALMAKSAAAASDQT